MTLAGLFGATPPAFLIMTVVLFGGAAIMAGHALARSWRPARQLLPYALLLAFGDRFLLYALFDGSLLSASGYGIAAAILLLLAALAYRWTRARQMVRQYPWLFAPAGPLRWRAKPVAGGAREA